MTNLQLLYTDTRLCDLLDVLDQLHDAVSEGRLAAVSTLDRAELVNLLREVVYTATETIAEMDGECAEQHSPTLRILPRASGAIS